MNKQMINETIEFVTGLFLESSRNDIPFGYYLVHQDIEIGFGAWRVTFKKGDVLYYDQKYRMHIWNGKSGADADWILKRPPIRGTDDLKISDYDNDYEQQQVLRKFLASVKKISEKDFEKMSSSKAESLSKNDLVENEGEYLPYLGKIIEHLKHAQDEIKKMLRLQHDGVVSDREIKMMNMTKDLITDLNRLVDKGLKDYEY